MELSRARSDLSSHGWCVLAFDDADADVALLAETVWGRQWSVTSNYVGGTSSRDVVAKGVFTVNQEPPDLSVTQHSEKTYSNSFPSHIAFFARRAADHGGETVLSDNLAVSAGLSVGMRLKLQTRGVQYTRRLTDSKRPLEAGESVYQTWQKSFETDQRAVVEAVCRTNDDTVQWDLNGDCTVLSLRPAFAAPPPGLVDLPTDVEEVLMNQLYTYHASHQEREAEADGRPDTNLYRPWLHLPRHQRPYHSRWGNGQELSTEELDELTGLYASHSVTIPLQSGEAVIANNFRFTHGRLPYSGPRELLVVMAADVPRHTKHVPAVATPSGSRL